MYYSSARKRRTLKAVLLSLVFMFVFMGSLTISPKTVTAQAASNVAGKWVKNKKTGKIRYKKTADKKYIKDQFARIKGRWYRFDKDGYLKTGWFTENGKTYFGRTSKKAGLQGRLINGWCTLNKKTYYFEKTDKAGSNGVLCTGWKTIGTRTFYFNKDGSLVTGWKTIGGKKFFFLKTGKNGKRGAMVTGWYTIGKVKYYFKPTGKVGAKGALASKEWLTVDGKKYYFKENGVINTYAIATQSQFIKKIGKLAQKDMKETGILASVTTAQAILECGYGTTVLALEAYNLFGMKANLSGNSWKSDWKGGTYKKQTMEYLGGKWYTITDTFRSYGSIAESIKDHSNYLRYAKNGSRLRYSGVVGNKSYRQTIQIIKNGGYATDPSYVSKICNIIERYNLTQYDK